MIEELRLHIGAHKTATTHLQDSLSAQSGRILQSGLVYLSRSSVRESRLVRRINENCQQRLGGWRGLRSLVLGSRGRIRSLEEVIVLPESHPRRILILEENIIGSSSDLLMGLYPRAAVRLAPWAKLMGDARPHIFLSIRNYADILPSAYSQALRDGTIREGMAAYRVHWLERKPSWVDLIIATRSVFGDARLTLWTLDYYSHSPSSVRLAMTGVDLPEEFISVPRNTRRLSTEAVRRIEALDQDLSNQNRMEAVNEIVMSDDGSDLFDPLPTSERAFHTERYFRDLEIIKQLPLEFLG